MTSRAIAGVAARGLECGPSSFVAAWFLELGHSLEDVVFARTASPHVFWELHWRAEPELPAHPPAEGRVAQREAYRQHLESREVRTPAARMTTFLLSVAVALAPRAQNLAEER